jgi:hypothetical protein
MQSSNSTTPFKATMNDWAKTSPWLGIGALLPYLLFSIVLYVEKRTEQFYFQAEFLLGLFCLFWGVLLGLITLIVGLVAIREIRNSQNTEAGTPSAVFGAVLGLSAIISNLLFLYQLIYELSFA